MPISDSKLEQKAGQGFKVNSIPRKTEPKLPTQEKVVQSHAMVRAQTGIQGLQTMTGKYEMVVTQAFDQLMDEADDRIKQHIEARLGASHSFFDFDVEAAFDQLMPTPTAQALPPSQATIDIQVMP